MFSTKRSHELALNILVWYLKNTQDCGLLLNPNDDIFKFDAYPDADFAGMYRGENNDDPEYAKIRNGFIITFSNFPVLWISKFKTETTFSTMEADIIDLDNCCWELFPIIDINQSLGKAVGLPVRFPSIKVYVREGNSGAPILAGNFL